MSDSNATLAAYAVGLVLMLGYAVTVVVSLSRMCRKSTVHPEVPARSDAPKAVAASEVKAPTKVRASSR